MNTVIDHLGNDVQIEPIQDDKFRLEACVQLGPTFYAWLFEAGVKVKLLEPSYVVDEYMSLLQDVLDEYAEVMTR